MGDKKETRREIKAVWGAVRDDRRAREKLIDAAELDASAERLAAHAAVLRKLAKRMRAIEAAAAAAALEKKSKRKAEATEAPSSET